VSGQECHRWPTSLARTVIIVFLILPLVIQAKPEAAQLPPSLLQWTNIDALQATEALKNFKRGMELYLKERYAAALEAFADGGAHAQHALDRLRGDER
jgi:hypothetical protein